MIWPGWKPSLRGWSCSGCIWPSWCWCSWSVLPQDRLRSSEIHTFDNEFFSVQNAKLRIWPPRQKSCRTKLTNWWRDKVCFSESLQKSYVLSHALNMWSGWFWPSATMCEKEKIVTSTSWECPGVRNNEAWWEIFTTLNILMISYHVSKWTFIPRCKTFTAQNIFSLDVDHWAARDNPADPSNYWLACRGVWYIKSYCFCSLYDWWDQNVFELCWSSGIFVEIRKSIS